MEELVHRKRMSVLYQVEVAVRVSKTLAQMSLLEGKVLQKPKLPMLSLSLSCCISVPIHLAPLQFLKLRRPLLPPYHVSKDTLLLLITWCICRSSLFLLALLKKRWILKKEALPGITMENKQNLCIYKGKPLGQSTEHPFMFSSPTQVCITEQETGIQQRRAMSEQSLYLKGHDPGRGKDYLKR